MWKLSFSLITALNQKYFIFIREMLNEKCINLDHRFPYLFVPWTPCDVFRFVMDPLYFPGFAAKQSLILPCNPGFSKTNIGPLFEKYNQTFVIA